MLLVLTGLALLPLAFLIKDPSLSAIVGGASVTAVAVLLVVYSYVIWRRDTATNPQVTDD